MSDSSAKFRMAFFQSPPVSEVKPVYIKEGQQTVEILSGGKLRFEIDGKERIFTRGTVFRHIYGEHTICKTFPEAPYQCYVFDLPNPGNQRVGPRVFTWGTPDEVLSFCAECFKAFHSTDTDMDALFRYASSVICWKAISYTSSLKASPPLVQQVSKLIQNNLQESLTPDWLAKRLGICRTHLFSLFKNWLHQTPSQFIQEKRLARAREMLILSAERPIKEIANLCGYAHLEVFYRHFTSTAGMTPKEYRQRYSIFSQSVGDFKGEA